MFYDVSNGSVYVTDLYVTYGGVQYKTNDLGYVITGTSTENIVNLDSATKLPPVTLKNLDIKMSNSATPINIMGNVDITIDGNCTLRSMMVMPFCKKFIFKQSTAYYKINRNKSTCQSA